MKRNMKIEIRVTVMIFTKVEEWQFACASGRERSKRLPKLAPHLSMLITVPIGKGKPMKDYPYAWSINK